MRKKHVIRMAEERKEMLNLRSARPVPTYMGSEQSEPIYIKAIVFVILLLLLSYSFSGALTDIWESWQTEDYSHGFLIPFVAAMFVANRFSTIKEESQASWTAVIVLVGCYLFQFSFEFVGIRGFIPQIYVFSILALIAAFVGNRVFVKLIAPLALLFFAIPLPKFLYYTMSFKMQTISTMLGTYFLNILSIPVFRDGNIIDLGDYQLEVAEACNGLRYLFPLLSVGYILAYVFKASYTKKIILFLSAVPLTIVMNAIRIAFIGVTVSYWGKGAAEGFTHSFEGWVVFMGCVLLLLAEAALLRRIGSGGQLNIDFIAMPRLDGIRRMVIGKPTLAATLVIVLGVIAQLYIPAWIENRLKPIPLTQPLSMFPLRIGSWVGKTNSLDSSSLSILGTDQYFIADYTSGEKSPVNLYMLYYPMQDSTTNQALHSPLFCVPAGGWSIDEDSTHSYQQPDGKSLTVNELVISKGTQKQIVYFWFAQGGVASADTNLAKFIQIKNAFLYGRADGAMLRLVTPVNERETPQAAEQRLDRFLDQSLKTIYGYLGWSFVFEGP